MYLRLDHSKDVSEAVVSVCSIKTPVLESFFIKVACLGLATLLKRDSSTGLFR